MTQGRYEIMIGRRVKRWVVVEEAARAQAEKEECACAVYAAMKKKKLWRKE